MPILLHAMLMLASTVQASKPIVTLSGRLVDANGKPMPAATVVVAEGPTALRTMALSEPAAAPRVPEVLASATTDNSGELSIAMPDEAREVPWRRSRLTVWAYHPDRALAVELIDRDWLRAGLPLAICLPAADIIRFKVTDANYEPVAHARVTPLRVAGQLLPEVLRERLAVRTGDDGRVALAGVAPDNLETVAVESEAIGVQWAGLPAQGRDKIVLLNLVPVGRLTGQLIADDPRAVARRMLRFATWQIPGDEDAGGGLAEAITDDEGKFNVPAIAAGSLTFEVERAENSLLRESAYSRGVQDDYQSAAVHAGVYLAAQATGPSVEAGKTATFDIPLRRAVRVIQEVREEDSHAPIAGARVRIRSGLTASTTGDTDTSGRLTGYILPGLVSSTLIRVSPSHYDPAGGLRSGTDVTESAQPVLLKVLELAKGVPLRGRVVDDNQRPLAGAEITGFSESPRKIPVHTWSNAQGEFTIDGVAAQASMLLWARHGKSTAMQPVSAQPQGPPATLIVGNGSGVSLDGRVVDAAARPIAAAVVRVWAQEPQLAGFRYNDLGSVLFGGSDRLITDAEGKFRTPPSLRPNAAYSLEVKAPGMVSAQTEAIEPAAWHTTHFGDVVLHSAPRLRAVSGRVVDRQGRSVVGAQVWQSGDGPRRTQTTTDDEGLFQLEGIYDGAAYLFARKDGFRLQGARTAAADKTCQITLRARDEPPQVMATLPPPLSLDEQRDLARSLVEPLLPILSEPVFGREHRELLKTIARVDPAKGLEIADTVLTDPTSKSMARHYAALSLALTDLDEALAVIALVDPPFLRVQTCAFACDELTDAPPERRVRLLDEALIHARTEPDPGLRARELGQIALRWLDMGQRERAVTVLREGQALVEALPAPDEVNLRISIGRGAFAGMLARIDGPAALPMLEGFIGHTLNRFRTDMARGLADHEPAEAERLFQLLDPAGLFFRMRLAPVARMAAADAERAARLARNYRGPCEQAFALGTVAHGMATKDRQAAMRLLEEAYALLDNASESGAAQNPRRGAALTAAALLPVAEMIDANLVEGYFWRSVSLRQPWPTASDAQSFRDGRVTQLAAMISRYDRSIARDLLAPLGDRFGMQFMIGPGVADPRWAAELVQGMPDVPAPLAKNPKLIAALTLAGWLGRPLRGFEGIWEQVYGHCDLRDPYTVDDVW